MEKLERATFITGLFSRLVNVPNDSPKWSIMKTYCSPIQGCGQECKPKVYDYSFAHEFGVEVRNAILSNCCEALITDEFERELSELELLSIKEWNEV